MNVESLIHTPRFLDYYDLKDSNYLNYSDLKSSEYILYVGT